MRYFYFIFSLSLLLSCNKKKAEQMVSLSKIEVLSLDTFPVPSSVRALEVLNDKEVWFAGSGGVYGYTQDGGISWQVDTLKYDTLLPHFRSISVNEKAIHLLSIASPALLFRSTDKGKNWELVYRENHPAAFYDAMTFWDEQNGLAMGDPTDGCLSVIRTEDAGKSWSKIACSNIPDAEEGEAAFAASNTNLSVAADGKAWMVSGGKRARVYKSDDYGKNWQAINTPIIEGDQMTGIYSVNFYDTQTGIIFGGNWNDKGINTQNKALSKDGGQTWTLTADGAAPGYQSCVRFFPGAEAKHILSTGIPGTHYSIDGGSSWQLLDDSSFYTFDFDKQANVIWLAGNGKIAKMKLEKK